VKSLKRAYVADLDRLRRVAPRDARVLSRLRPWLHHDVTTLRETERIKLAEMLPNGNALHRMQSMRSELAALWERSMDTQHHLVDHLHDWCRRARGHSGARGGRSR